MEFTDNFCQDCNRGTPIVVDYSTGDTICTECGCVLESHFVTESCEWRTFDDDNHDKADPNRVGDTSDPLLSQGNLTTFISKAKDTKMTEFPKLHNQENFLNRDKELIRCFQVISSMADRLGIVSKIVARAKEISRDVMEGKKMCKAKSQNAMSAACLFVACRECKAPRTLKEMCSVAEGVKKKQLGKAVEVIKKHLEVDMECLSGGELVRRFCSNLGMKNQDMKAVQEAVQKSGDFDIRRNPKSVLAALIYIIAQLSDDKKSLRDISVTAEVAEGTIKKSYKDVYPYASRLIPHWYAAEDDLKKLCYP